MAKVGINLKIDVKKIEKARMFQGEKGTYLDMTMFVDLDNADQYGNNGMITQNWKDQQKGEGPILGNGKIFWRDQSAPVNQNPVQGMQSNGVAQGEPDTKFDDDVPF